MLHAIAPNIWHVPHHFTANGLPVSSRMTIVRLESGGLWLHSPVPLCPADTAELGRLGNVDYIVAPSKTHHLFIAECVAAFPKAKLFGAPGLSAKRPDLDNLTELSSGSGSQWSGDLDQIFFDGIPVGNETVWFHKSSRTLILTDLCQWWQGDLPFAARLYATVIGARRQLTVPRHIRWLVKNRQSARASAQKILQWPIERVVTAHNAIVEDNAHAAVKEAFSVFIA